MRKTVVTLLWLIVLHIVPAAAMELGSMSDPTPAPTPAPTPMSLDVIDTSNLSVTPDLPGERRNILLLSTDTGSSSKGARTDIIMIVSINTVDGDVKITSIMGDMVVPVTTMSGECMEIKIDSVVGYGGNDAVMKTVNELFGMNITEYVMIDFARLKDVVDALGGIYIDVSPAERKQITKSLGELAEYLVAGGPTRPKTDGTNKPLNGQQTIDYARIRRVDGADTQPVERQKIVLETIFDRLKDADVNQLYRVASQSEDVLSTNINTRTLVTIATTVIQYGGGSELNGHIPDASTSQVSEMRDGVWGIYDVDFEANKLLLHQYVYAD